MRSGELSTAASAAAGPSNTTDSSASRQSRFAGLKARVASASSTNVSAPTNSESQPAALSGAAEPADSLTRIRPVSERTAGEAARPGPKSPSEPPPEPPADHRPSALQLDRFKFVRPKPAGVKRSAGPDPAPAAGPDPSPAAKSTSYSSVLDVDDMDDDFESLLSGNFRGGAGGSRGGHGSSKGGGEGSRDGNDRSKGGGGNRGGGSGRGGRSGRPAQTRAKSDRAPSDRSAQAGVGTKRSPPATPDEGGGGGTGGGQSAPSPAPGRRALSAATLSKLARFSADADTSCDAPLAAMSRPADPGPRDSGSPRPADRTTLPVSSGCRQAAAAPAPASDTGQSQFESADDGLCDLELDFSWPPSKRPRS